MNSALPDRTRTDVSSVERGLWHQIAKCLPLLLICLVALVYRSPHFGNPDVDYDEEFYLLVADRMWHGATVYVDIWDRKPIGLFLIFLLAKAMGGTGVLQYQLLSWVFVCVTGFFMWKLAQRYTDRWLATLPALLYVLWIETYYGGAGQVGVFFNMFTMIAVWLTVQAKDNASSTTILRNGYLAMLCFGIGIQIKYTVIPEGIYIGLYLLYLLHRQKAALSKIIRAAVLFGMIALAPTIAAGIYYAAIGHFQEFYFANFVSIFLRGRLTDSFVQNSLSMILLVATPLIIASLLGLAKMRRSGRENANSDSVFFLGWAISAAIGFAMIGNFYIHYFVSVLLPLCAITAPVFTPSLMSMALFILLSVIPIKVSGFSKYHTEKGRIRAIEEMTAIIKPRLKGQCLYVFDGPAALYMTTQSCLPTRFAYPDHLSNDVEKSGIGVDATQEIKHVLALRPPVIVYARVPVIPKMNEANVAILKDTLKREYSLIRTVDYPGRPMDLYGLRAGISAPVTQ